jgi:hypothetical protein
MEPAQIPHIPKGNGENGNVLGFVFDKGRYTKYHTLSPSITNQ